MKTITLTLILANLLEANSVRQPGTVWSEEDQKMIEEKLLYIMDNPKDVMKLYKGTNTHKNLYSDKWAQKNYKDMPPTATKVSLNGFFKSRG